LVARLAEPGGAVAAARELAGTIAANGPLAIAATKRILTADEGDAWERQAEIADPVFASEDAREGAQAFAEKRPPVWRGR
jgi:enoyl-CoA hydratase